MRNPATATATRERAASMPRAIQLDCYRVTGSTSWRAVAFAIIGHRTFRPIATMRAYQALRARGGLARLLRPFVTATHHWFCLLASADLPPALSTGPGLAIVHGWGVVVNQGARFGRNVTLMQDVTIGRADAIAADGSRTTGYPVIGNDVWIGPGAVVVGGVHIGDGCRILANSVVTTDLAAGTMAGGIPAKALKTDAPLDVMNPVDRFLTG